MQYIEILSVPGCIIGLGLIGILFMILWLWPPSCKRSTSGSLFQGAGLIIYLFCNHFNYLNKQLIHYKIWRKKFCSTWHTFTFCWQEKGFSLKRENANTCSSSSKLLQETGRPASTGTCTCTTCKAQCTRTSSSTSSFISCGLYRK